MGRSLDQLERDLLRAAKEVAQMDDRVRTHVAGLTEQYARNLSSGPFTSSQLAAMDHPFAVRHGSPRLDPGVINKQTGLFYRSWVADRVRLPDGSLSLVVRNRAPYAPYLEHGTSTAFARPLEDRLAYFAEREWLRIGPRMIETALINSLGP
jgi:hypothetical protein